MNAWIATLGSVFFVSLLSLIGVFTLALRREVLKKLLLYFISFAVGSLYGSAFMHLLPEAFLAQDDGPATGAYVLSGIALFFVIEKFIRRSQHFPGRETRTFRPQVPLILMVDSVHNFIDGALIGASYSVSPTLGIATTLAVVFHEIPHEIADFAVLVHGGLTIKKALLFNFLTALTAVLGGVFSLLIGARFAEYSVAVLAFTAGGFIYIAGSDLIPELQAEVRFTPTLFQLTMMLTGAGLMGLLLLMG